MNILLIAGGWSPEREISITGAQNIEEALLSLGHQVTFFDLAKNFNELCAQARKHDFAFINLHGSPGEDGLIQAMLDAIHCPYQGSGPAGSFLALNKAAAKQIFRQNNLPTGDWELLTKLPNAEWRTSLKWPLFVKSNIGGSSLHLAKVSNKEELELALKEIFLAGEEAIIESLINGKDITCGILGNKALPPVLIEPHCGEFFDFQSKYNKNGAKEICPAPISAQLTDRVMELALKAHHSLGLSGYSRADFIMETNGNLTLLEVNTLPGMTATSLVPQEAFAIGISFPQLIQELITLGIKRCS